MKYTKIQHAAEAMLSILLANAMFMAPAVYAQPRPIDTSNINLSRVLPHYLIRSKSLHHLLQSSNGLDFGNADKDMLHQTNGSLESLFFGKYTYNFYLPSDGFIRNDAIKPISKTSKYLYGKSSDQYQNRSRYAQIITNQSTMTITKIGLYENESDSDVMNNSDKATISGLASAYNIAKDSWNSDHKHRLVGISYHVHTAILDGKFRRITLYPYKEMFTCSHKQNPTYKEIKYIPTNEQKYYPLKLNLTQRHAVAYTTHQAHLKSQQQAKRRKRRMKQQKEKRWMKHKKRREHNAHAHRPVESGGAPSYEGV